ncbi:hypothetical protein [Sphingomonas sp. 2R-10]|uniref:hypothetical protein n=1 Tax=Sphingomonas sp. 2R-10 TaxID=3045148 RepID=UPI0013DD92E6|nr:hypothetical protein [Sphingomonas sp. 2R-10]
MKRQTPPENAQRSSYLTLHSADPRAILQELELSGYQLTRLVTELHHLTYNGGIEEAEYGARLFDPGLTDIRLLPPGLLDAKEELLPPTLIPRTREDLKRFLRRLMILNGEEVNYDVLVKGWTDRQGERHALDHHVSDLWRIRDANIDVYDGLVAGRFATVIRHLKTVDTSAYRTKLRGVLIRQALIWCSHDVQLVVARIAKPVDLSKLGVLRDASAERSPQRAANSQTERYDAIAETLDAFFGCQDWRRDDVELAAPAAETLLAKPKHVWFGRILRRLRSSVKSPAGPDLKQVTVLMRAVAAQMRHPDLAGTEYPKYLVKYKGPKTFPAKWHHLTSPVSVIATAVRRLIQAEHEIPAIVDDLIANRQSKRPTQLRGSLSSYDNITLPRGATERLDELAAFYHDTFISAQATSEAVANWKHRKETADFLREMGARRPGDHHGNTRRRSFYLLDIIPEHRFAAGN